MAKVLPDGTIVRNIMADGTECDDLSTYIKSPDQIPDLTMRMMVNFLVRGARLRMEREQAEQQQGVVGG